MFISCRFNFAFFNLFLELDVIWCMQYTKVRPSPSQATYGDSKLIVLLFLRR